MGSVIGRFRHRASLGASLALVATLACSIDDNDWRGYGGNRLGDRYSSLNQITRDNVALLQPAWRVDAGAGSLQTQPLVIDGRLYALTTDQDVIALDAETGAMLWRFETGSESWQPVRGLTWWEADGQTRLFSAADRWLFAIDPTTGTADPAFGDGGRIDLGAGLSRPGHSAAVYMTSPGVIYDDLIITGFRTTESSPAAPGRVRAYDVRTGALRWQFNLLPQPGERGAETWPETRKPTAGGANAWAGMTVDESRGLVFVPTGSATDDFYGADRHGDNLFANSLVALDAATGEYRWHFQGVRHDIWDRDFPSPPVLLTITQQGKAVDVVAQASKQGFLFVLTRDTGEPVFPVEDVPFPASDTPGESSAQAQPVPSKPAPYVRQRIAADQLSQRTPEVNRAAREALASMKNLGPFTPLAVDQTTLVMPGFDGGAEWGGQAVDRSRGIFIINSNEVAWTSSLISPGEVSNRAEALYQQHCMSCHGADRAGSPPNYPSLIGVAARMNDFDFISLVLGGRGRMPAIRELPFGDIGLIKVWLNSEGHTNAGPANDERHAKSVTEETAPAAGPKYVFSGYKKFSDADGYPAISPPWGTLSAIDLNTGDYVWRKPLGVYPELAEQGMVDTGTENYGGPIVTASGLIFIGATVYDRRLRAFDVVDGTLLWEAQLPFAGNATPITYSVGGRQFVVIAASGGKNRQGPQGAAYVAFSLPEGALQ